MSWFCDYKGVGFESKTEGMGMEYGIYDGELYTWWKKCANCDIEKCGWEFGNSGHFPYSRREVARMIASIVQFEKTGEVAKYKTVKKDGKEFYVIPKFIVDDLKGKEKSKKPKGVAVGIEIES